jgi:hypothetical protein
MVIVPAPSLGGPFLCIVDRLDLVVLVGVVAVPRSIPLRPDDRSFDRTADQNKKHLFLVYSLCYS